MNKIYVVGIGPGSYEKMTIEAAETLAKCDVIAGYTVYIDLVKDHFSDKEFLSTPMKKEKERCELAFQKANEDKAVAMICSGDAGVYGMAGLIYELSEKYPETEIEVIGGTTAAISGAAVLGAPLVHDFCLISLSDLLTDWELIEERIDCAAKGDFVTCFYNPSSMKRHDYLQKACDIMMKHKAGSTVCGIVRNIGREGQEAQIMDLATLRDTQVDMFTTVFVGNSQTKVIGGKMVTPRGYKNV